MTGGISLVPKTVSFHSRELVLLKPLGTGDITFSNVTKGAKSWSDSLDHETLMVPTAVSSLPSIWSSVNGLPSKGLLAIEFIS